MGRYYDKYKEIDKNVQKLKDSKQAPIAYLKKIDQYNLIPSPMGLVSNKGDNRIINIKSFKIGDKYASALADGLKYSAAETINLA